MNGSNGSNPAARRDGWWVAGQTLLLAAVGIAGPFWSGNWPTPVSIVLGSAAFLYAAWTGLSGVVSLGQNRTPRPSPRAGSTLVTTGIYGLIRHPLYASMMAMAVGWSCFWSSGVTLVIAAVLIVFLHAKALYEEKLLQIHFPGYRSYASQLPRYIPRLPPSGRGL